MIRATGRGCSHGNAKENLDAKKPDAQCVVILNALQEEIRATLFVVSRCHGGEARSRWNDVEAPFR